MPVQVITSPLNPLIPHGPEDTDFKDVVVEVLPSGAESPEGTFLKSYDTAMRDWLRGVTAWDGRVMPIVFAAPLRAMSQFRELLKLGQITPLEPPQDGDLNFAKAPLPFISFVRGDFRPGTRQNQNYPIRNVAFLDDTNKRRTAFTRYPMSMIIPYQIEVWTKGLGTQAYLMQRIMGQFWPKIAYWQVKTPFLTDFTMPILLKGVSDTSTLEGGQDGERVLRLTFSVEVEAWMFFDLVQAPTFLREVDEIGTMKSGGGDEVIDKVINTDQSGGLANPGTEAIRALPQEAPKQAE